MAAINSSSDSAFLTGTDHDSRAMGIIGANVQTSVSFQFLKSHPDVCLDVFNQMPDVDRTVGIRQGAGDEYLSSHMTWCSFLASPLPFTRGPTPEASGEVGMRSINGIRGALDPSRPSPKLTARRPAHGPTLNSRPDAQPDANDGKLWRETKKG